MKRFISCLIFIAILFSLGSCSSEVRMEHCELGIILPDGFEPYDSDGTFDVAYTDGELIAGLARVSYPAGIESGVSSTLTAHSFAEIYADRSGRVDSIVFDYGDCAYFTYADTVDYTTYRYTHTFYKTPYAYFVISFISKEGSAWSIEGTLKLTKNVYLINL